MSIERIQITDRQQWLELRKRDCTASTVGALLGVSEYQTRYGLWALKSGLTAEEPDDPVIDDYSITISPMGRGTLLEDKAGELLRLLKPNWIVKKCNEYYRDPAARLGATPDFLANDPDTGDLIVIQVKNPEQSIYRKKWRQDDGSIEPPIDYVAQAIVEAHLTGATRAYVGALIIGHQTEFRLIEAPIHEGLIDHIRLKVAEFWAMVEAKTPPEFDYERDAGTIARLYGTDDESTIILDGWNAAVPLADEDAVLAEEIKGRADRRKAIKAEVLAKIGPAAIAMLDGRIFATARTVNKKAYAIAATSYRDLRIKRSA
jgi:predicted phage-related endonuclease